MKTAIVTYAYCGNTSFSYVTLHTIPTIRYYAKRCRADFICHEEEPPHFDGTYSLRARMMLYKFDVIYKALETYDRVLWIDADVIVRPDSPNLFDLVSEDRFACGEGYGLADRLTPQHVRDSMFGWCKRIWEICQVNNWRVPEVGCQVLDTGVMLASQQHQDLFTPLWGTIPENNGGCEEQLALNIRFFLSDHKLFALPMCFNCPYVFFKPQHVERFNYFIHYALLDNEQKAGYAIEHLIRWRRDYPEWFEGDLRMSGLCFRQGTWDEAIWKDMTERNEYGIELFDPYDIVVDIGAHIGGFTYKALDLGAGLVVAVEPDTDNANHWRHNLHRVCQAQCRSVLLTGAAWRSDGYFASLYFNPSTNPENTGGGGVIDKQGTEVRAIPFDSIIDLALSCGVGRETIKLVKLDCEGSEWPILLTSNRLHKIDIIIGEFHEVLDLTNLPAIRVADYTRYDEALLKDFLENRNFAVETFRTQGTLGKFIARRKA
jgi:FkbM family methyltransferase